MDDPTAAIWAPIHGLWTFGALKAFVEIGVPQALGDGPMSLRELAPACAADERNLGRLMRASVALGWVERVGDDGFALSESGRLLHPAHPDSLRGAVRFAADPVLNYPQEAIAATVRSGRPGFIDRFGPAYDYFATHPETAEVFDTYMTARALPVMAALLERHDFSSAARVLDVGGGYGHFLAAILTACPQLHGTLLEREEPAGTARANLAAAGLAGRSEVVVGDFFQAVPAGADLYLLSSIIHNWDDTEARTVLRNVREAMAPGGRVILVEMVLPADDRPHMGKLLDLRIMAMFGAGGERTRAEYAELLREAGLTLTDVVELTPAFSAVVATRTP